MYVKCNLPQPTTFKNLTVGTLTPHALHEACRASLSARPNAGRERASRDVLRDRERVLHERGRAARVAADSRRRATSRRRHDGVARPETASARAAGAGWTGRGTRAIERRPSGARHTHRGVVLRALLGDQEVRPDPTLPATRRVRTPENSRSFPRAFRSRSRGTDRRRARASARAVVRRPTVARPLSIRERSRGCPARLAPTNARRTAPPAPDRFSASRTIHDSSRRGVAQTPRFFFSRNALTDGPTRKNPTSARAGQGPLGRTRGGGEHAHRGRGRGSWDKVKGMPGFKSGGGGGRGVSRPATIFGTGARRSRNRCSGTALTTTARRYKSPKPISR